ncbi:MAG: prolipoprotein diacylglyceryl transferase [Melioribacteraceae bacterium]|nr:prolipoprotein diacylglyceryl transferase [Melioribacteraceae bacterium]
MVYLMITWSIDPEIFSLGPITVRWYGLLFALSFVAGFQIMDKIFKRDKRTEDDLNDLVWYMIVGTIVGARLGHCLFYNPVYYLSNPLELLAIWHGGLASHGAAIGILSALYFYSKKKKESYFWIIDKVVITVALAGFFIRLGNLFNSEIIGIPTELPWSFTFTSVDNIPRHPAQLYESIAYLLVFFLLFYIDKNKFKTIKNGTLFSIFLILVFGFRFFVEFIKEKQTYFEDGLALNMGQMLSIPLIIYGIILFYQKVIKEKSLS